MPRLRLGSERQLGDDRSLTRQCLVQPAIFFGIDDIDAAGDDGDAAGLERAQMCRGIDASGQARSDDDAAPPERRGEVAAETPAIGRGVAAPTIATIGLPSNSARPSTVRIGGASSTAMSPLG